ncbi:sulfotransferase family 2 domain-containing protein [Christiangramia sp. SM2212]|uniref:Sulfotransferase family 2 domain-containing protein n=1 Tax=Christiangramia sediminicola TaxID=3073267 RepID=A0ABU1EMT5_9FLAO|nr:sulfotransferase family 2 domain-containing protein [Christiangramia sp. SM2212]MDR5589698.1 sulfotransferase family 2 domain-containing protein [Christiangramia sp. SM2212]
MISHKHKCIFIHISKCAGTTVENAFGIDTKKYNEPDYEKLFGWSEKLSMWLQHATPQQLLDNNLISENHWNNYYKFIIYRNSWSRSFSDYHYLKSHFGIDDSFFNYLNKKGDFFGMLDKRGNRQYVGEHLFSQKPYFFLDDRRIDYDKEINFENLDSGFKELCEDLSLESRFFSYNLNIGDYNNKVHYSHFYNSKKKKMVANIYFDDIEFFGFKFCDQRSIFQKLKNEFKG